ncbi:MAG: HD domain-containing protein [Lachnospiraceae bacterium]|nr:HD domain-containing protein [Lachnospiraceae bacterium]
MFPINRESTQKVFDNYVNQFDVEDDKVRLKIEHTERVTALCERIALSLKLPKEDVDLAWLMGLLHDVGRFEQLKDFGTFNDAQSIDHAKYGVKLLFEEGHIRDYLEETAYDNLIRTAIWNHNVFRLPENLTERELLFSQILRDADKIDILRVNVEIPIETIYNCTTEELKNVVVTEEVLQSFAEEHAVEHRLKKTPVDHIVGHASLVFELVYPISIAIVKEQGYLEKILQFTSENTKTREQFTVIADIMHHFIEQKVLRDGNCAQ